MNEVDFKIFQEPPTDLDETWRHGALLGGMATGAYDCLAIATAFKATGDSLIKGIPSEFEAYEVIHPVLYNYRHSLELYLKAIVRPAKKNHSLKELLDQFTEYTKSHHGVEPPGWFKNVILEFHDYDPKSVAFRYHEVSVVSTDTGNSGEFWVDLVKVKKIMDGLQRSFLNVANKMR